MENYIQLISISGDFFNKIDLDQVVIGLNTKTHQLMTFDKAACNEEITTDREIVAAAINQSIEEQLPDLFRSLDRSKLKKFIKNIQHIQVNHPSVHADRLNVQWAGNKVVHRLMSRCQPTEVLAKIMTYIEEKDYWRVALVSKLWQSTLISHIQHGILIRIKEIKKRDLDIQKKSEGKERLIGSLSVVNTFGYHPGGPLLECNLRAYRVFCELSPFFMSFIHIRSIDRDFKQLIRLSEIKLEKCKKETPSLPKEIICDCSVGEVEVEIEIEQELYENPS